MDAEKRVFRDTAIRIRPLRTADIDTESPNKCLQEIVINEVRPQCLAPSYLMMIWRH
jgi:hypothetical protein